MNGNLRWRLAYSVAIFRHLHDTEILNDKRRDLTGRNSQTDFCLAVTDDLAGRQRFSCVGDA